MTFTPSYTLCLLLGSPQLAGVLRLPLELFILVVLASIALLLRSRVAHARELSESEKRHRIDAALSEQRVTRQQNEALTEEIRERRKVESQLRDMAFHDSLTGLHNRAFLLESLKESMRQTRSRPPLNAAVVYVDLDSFKVINDLAGHRVGDLLLVEVARRIKQNLRPRRHARPHERR